jgi:hypothetical protein
MEVFNVFPKLKERIPNIENKFKQIISSFENACKVNQSKDLLAFKLEIKTEKSENLYTDFGGKPDFRIYEREIKNESADAFVNRLWPKCGFCHKPMTFVGQIDLGDWLYAFHSFMATKDRNQYVSPFGKFIGIESDLLYFRYLSFWFCNEPHFFVFNNANACAKISKYKDILSESLTFFGRDLQPAVNFFYDKSISGPEETKDERNEVYIPKEMITDIEIKWDIITNDFNRQWSTYNRYPELFMTDRNSYVLFGADVLQSESPSFISQRRNSSGDPIPMMPIINWRSRRSNITNQLYVDFSQFEHYEELDWNAFGLLHSITS